MQNITVRDLDGDYAAVPRHWCAGSATATAISNGVNMLFPHGERFFVRSVKHFLERIEDPTLRAQIKGFFGQEGRHAREHDRFNAILREQGYQVDEFLDIYRKLTFWVEARLSPELNLAITAACEHFTAIMAEGAFTEGMLDAMHPQMRALLAWHAAEEIEHKAVAYDVLQQVDPSYRLRVLGLVLATTFLGGFWLWGARTLLAQDGLTLRDAVAELRRARAAASGATGMAGQSSIIRRVFVRGIRQYLRRDFHPSQQVTDTLAATWFAARGMTLPEAA